MQNHTVVINIRILKEENDALATIHATAITAEALANTTKLYALRFLGKSVPKTLFRKKRAKNTAVFEKIC